MFRIVAVWLLLASTAQAAAISIEDGKFTTQDGRLYYSDPTPEYGRASLPVAEFSTSEDWSYDLPVHIDPNTVATGRVTIGLSVEFSSGIAFDIAGLNRDESTSFPPNLQTDLILRVSYSKNEPRFLFSYFRTPVGPWVIGQTMITFRVHSSAHVSIFAESVKVAPTLGQVYAAVPEPAARWLCLVPMLMRSVRRGARAN
jgi:hypothetical protein